MPRKLVMTELQTIFLGGVPMTIAEVLPHGRRVVVCLGGYDADGLLDGKEETEAAARLHRAKSDIRRKRRRRSDDKGTE